MTDKNLLSGESSGPVSTGSKIDCAIFLFNIALFSVVSYPQIIYTNARYVYLYQKTMYLEFTFFMTFIAIFAAIHTMSVGWKGFKVGLIMANVWAIAGCIFVAFTSMDLNALGLGDLEVMYYIG